MARRSLVCSLIGPARTGGFGESPPLSLPLVPPHDPGPYLHSRATVWATMPTRRRHPPLMTTLRSAQQARPLSRPQSPRHCRRLNQPPTWTPPGPNKVEARALTVVAAGEAAAVAATSRPECWGCLWLPGRRRRRRRRRRQLHGPPERAKTIPRSSAASWKRGPSLLRRYRRWLRPLAGRGHRRSRSRPPPSWQSSSLRPRCRRPQGWGRRGTALGPRAAAPGERVGAFDRPRSNCQCPGPRSRRPAAPQASSQLSCRCR